MATAWLSFFAPLGPEPFDPHLTVDALQERLGRRTTSLKSLLLNQNFIAGLGNIYVDEILFACNLHPPRAGRFALRVTGRRPPGHHTGHPALGHRKRGHNL